MKPHDWNHVRTELAEHDYDDLLEGKEKDPQAIWKCRRCNIIAEVDAPYYHSESDIDADGYFRGMVMGYDGSADPPPLDHFRKSTRRPNQADVTMLDDCDIVITIIVMDE